MTRLPGDRAVEPNTEPGIRRDRLTIVLWVAAFLILVVWTVWGLDVFPLSTSVAGVPVPRALITVDHPFHTARAELVRSAWASFDTVRWVASHQGGYPTEFFPFGLPAVAAAFSLVTFGALAIESAWAITIALIFLLPGLAFWLLGRRDGISPGAALLALAGQVAIASDWTHGGYTELVEWGLATNVAGATYALLAIPLIAAATEQRTARWVGASAVVIALCAVSNPRSLVAVVVITAAFAIHAAIRRSLREHLPVIAVIGVLALGLSAPVVVPLLRYEGLYFFLSYQEYAALADYRAATVDAVTWPVLALATVGAVLSFLTVSHRATQVTAIALGLYVAGTGLAVRVEAVRELVPQLELPRLMPFQRLLVIWLAGYAVLELARRGTRGFPRLQGLSGFGTAVIGAVVVIVIFTTSAGPFPPLEQGLREVPRSEGGDGTELVAFRDAVALGDDIAEDGDAILVIGSRLSWHQQLWAPMEAPQRRFYYNDWLWYWHTRHAGPYDYRMGHYYPDPSQVLSREYLDAHGIGAVVITDVADQSTGASARQAAASSPDLERVDTLGAWDVYAVTGATGLGSLNGRSPDTMEYDEDDETIRMTFVDAEPGVVTVRQNWFPRWAATVNGEPVDPQRGENGYIEFPVDSGDLEIELRYTATVLDMAARGAAMVSLVAIIVLVLRPRPILRWVRR